MIWYHLICTYYHSFYVKWTSCIEGTPGVFEAFTYCRVHSYTLHNNTLLHTANDLYNIRLSLSFIFWMLIAGILDIINFVITTLRLQGLRSLSSKTSYRQISRSREATSLGFKWPYRFDRHLSNTANKYSLLMHRIKIKSPANFFYGMIKTFLWVDLSLFNQSYSGGITTTKSLPDIGGTTIQDVDPLAAMAGAMEPGVLTMSDELILQISCNIFLAFKWTWMMRSGQNISHYTTATPSVHMWNHDLIW